MASKWIDKKRSIDELVEKLKNHNEIIKVSKSHFFLKVTFQTGIREYWALNKEGLAKRRTNVYKLPDGLFFAGNIPKLYDQFEMSELIPNSRRMRFNFLYKEKELLAMGWCERRIFLHHLITKLVEEGWRDLWYSEDLLEEDAHKLLNEDLTKYNPSLIRHNAFVEEYPGKRIMLHCGGFEAHKYWTTYDIYRALKDYVDGDITRERIAYKLITHHLRVRHPGFLRSIFKKWLPVKGLKVLDLAPDWGLRGLGIMADGGYYYWSDMAYPNVTPTWRGIGNIKSATKLFNAECGLDKLGHYDVVILNDVCPGKLEDLPFSEYKGKADYLVVTVSASERKVAIEKYRPWRTLRLKNDPAKSANYDDYVLIIDQR